MRAFVSIGSAARRLAVLEYAAHQARLDEAEAAGAAASGPKAMAPVERARP